MLRSRLPKLRGKVAMLHNYFGVCKETYCKSIFISEERCRNSRENIILDTWQPCIISIVIPSWNEFCCSELNFTQNFFSSLSSKNRTRNVTTLCVHGEFWVSTSFCCICNCQKEEDNFVTTSAFIEEEIPVSIEGRYLVINVYYIYCVDGVSSFIIY